ncbi:MAG: ABC transporter substrate-binding protein, partial [Hyphomonas sp.]|nr:ABC transporter substrate-binding protein [Hyphomonas sp.]
LIAEFRTRLAAISKRTDRKSALYVTPGGVTSGPGSMVDEMLKAAGLQNFEEEPGWRDIPLEKLAYEQPDVIAAAVFR